MLRASEKEKYDDRHKQKALRKLRTASYNNGLDAGTYCGGSGGLRKISGVVAQYVNGWMLELIAGTEPLLLMIKAYIIQFVDAQIIIRI